MVGVGSSCGACKFLRRKCEEICIFAPYFSYDHAEVHFAAVHKVFGASNVSKLLLHLPVYNRSMAALTISFEAQARIRDPIRGCVSQILALQQQVMRLQEEIDSLTTSMVSRSCSEYTPPISHQPTPTGFSVQNDDLNGHSNNDIFEPRLQELEPVYKEAIEQLENCLFSDEQSSWEESIYMSQLEKDLLY